MNELFFVPAVKINARIADTVIIGNHIKLNDYTYERVSRRPKGRSIFKRLQSMDGNTKLTIYS